jgi:hypothetical protein
MVLRILKLCLGSTQAWLGSAPATYPRLRLARCSRPQTKMEPAKGKINTESMGIPRVMLFPASN